MHFFFAILGYELSPRRAWRVYLPRLSVALGGAALMLLWYLAYAATRTPTAGMALLGLMHLRLLGWTALTLAGFLAPYWGASALLRERESSAWDMLRLTGFSVPGLVLARWFTALWRTAMLLAALVPLMALTTSFGSMMQQVGMALLLILGLTVAGTGIGLALGAWMLSWDRLLTLIIVVAVCLFVLPPVLADLLAPGQGLSGRPNRSLTELLSPHLLLAGLAVQPDWGLLCLRLGLDLAIGLLGCLTAMALLPRRLFVADANRRRALRGTWLRRPGLRRSILGNPVTWKDFRIHGRGVLGLLQRFTLQVFIAAGVTAAVCRLAGQDWVRTAFICLCVAAVVSLLRFVLGYVHGVCAGLQQELDEQSLELLMLTDLKPSEILFGKQLAVYQSLVLDVALIYSALAGCLWLVQSDMQVQQTAGVLEQAAPLLAGIGLLLAIVLLTAMWYPVAGVVLLSAVVARRYTVTVAIASAVLMLTVVLPVTLVLTLILSLLGPVALLAPVLIFVLLGVLLRWLAVLALARKRVTGLAR